MRRKEEQDDEGKRPDLGGGRSVRETISDLEREKTERRPGLPFRPCAMYTRLEVTAEGTWLPLLAPPVDWPAARPATQRARKAPTAGKVRVGPLAESRVAIQNTSLPFCTV